MSLSTRIIRYLPARLPAVAAVAAPGAQAAWLGIEEAAFTAHWKHEDSMYEADRLASVRCASGVARGPLEPRRIPSTTRFRPVRDYRDRNLVPDEGTDRLAVLTAAAGRLCSPSWHCRGDWHSSQARSTCTVVALLVSILCGPIWPAQDV